MSKKLKMPEKGLFGLPSSVRQNNNETESAENQVDNNHETVITAKRLDDQLSESSDVQSISHLVEQDNLPQGVQETGILGDRETSSLGGQVAKHQNVQESEGLDGNTPNHLGGKCLSVKMLRS